MSDFENDSGFWFQLIIEVLPKESRKKLVELSIKPPNNISYLYTLLNADPSLIIYVSNEIQNKFFTKSNLYSCSMGLSYDKFVALCFIKLYKLDREMWYNNEIYACDQSDNNKINPNITAYNMCMEKIPQIADDFNNPNYILNTIYKKPYWWTSLKKIHDEIHN